MNKILFVGNTFIGSNLRIKRLTSEINAEYKILSYYKHSNQLKSIDWLIDALNHNKYSFFPEKRSPRCNKYYMELLYDELNTWKPDLIISDVEPISAFIARHLNIKLWYVSPLVYLFETHEKMPGHLRIYRNKLLQLPKADKYIIYHPLIISKKYEHVCSSHESHDIVKSEDSEILNKGIYLSNFFKPNFVMNSGETDFISDAINNNKEIYVLPKYKDIEAMLNAYILEKLNVGINLGTINSSNEFISNNLIRNVSGKFKLNDRKLCT